MRWFSYFIEALVVLLVYEIVLAFGVSEHKALLIAVLTLYMRLCDRLRNGLGD